MMKSSLKDEILWYQEDTMSPEHLAVPGSTMQTVLQELNEQAPFGTEELQNALNTSSSKGGMKKDLKNANLYRNVNLR